MAEQLFTDEHAELLLALLRLNTISPMETGRPSEIARAQEMYAAYALDRERCVIAEHASPDPHDVRSPDVPLSVRECAERLEEAFWESQPNMVLRFGRQRPLEETVMFNFHMDTVDGVFPASFDGERFVGRGAVDMKGPGVAVLAGIQAALKEQPDLLDRLSILIQCVSGEEGGAMGVYGTKLLAERGWLGRLNVFAEPSNGLYFDRSTTSMTARIEVSGQDATDDAPHQGHNSSLLLGYLAQQLARDWPERFTAEGSKICLAGLHTGRMHNKVYGSGQLLFNFAYASEESGRNIRRWLDEAFAAALRGFAAAFASVPAAALTAREAGQICRLVWVKQGLPVLANRDADMEAFLSRIGLKRCPDELQAETFTCDAMWAQRPDVYTIVYGPGSLAGNRAHADGEFITRSELETYARSIRDLLIALGKEQSNKQEEVMKA
ncbi:M20/M25/M40 family metallo-hydrolase [Xylanibacillus composti]|uniref:M20/M25/M40 family metallo-hydrolase n=1 Tax=Xylanibacillus composti TaxID=1572762 RepID=A0A8J4H3T7_9BACL|nr:M20/M25/M40 family metallo-hydrolase [Xylanibacillus composti]MDT9726197.1 M20/M25/M40 family metallo-hydrolase [Xylanibacillus composti]GIQ68043.1 M20/M25/M40 family metallo-hydrolase [Xylanibacillus composti]